MSTKVAKEAKEEMSNFEAISTIFILIGFILNGVLIYQGLHEPGDSVIFPTFVAIFIMVFIAGFWSIPHRFISLIPIIREMWWIVNLIVLYWIPFKVWFL